MSEILRFLVIIEDTVRQFAWSYLRLASRSFRLVFIIGEEELFMKSAKRMMKAMVLASLLVGLTACVFMPHGHHGGGHGGRVHSR
ncbi:hypothetical protein GCM10009112_13530 [Marinomonas arenicola]